MAPSTPILKFVVGAIVYVTWLFGDVRSPSVAVTVPIVWLPVIPAKAK